MSEVVLRALVDADCGLLLAWRNDPFIVERSLSQRTVTLEEHRQWFAALMLRNDVLAWIVEVNGTPAGHARAVPSGQDWLFTIYLVGQETGRGLGVEAIRQACRKCAQARPNAKVIAEVLSHNAPALTAFTRAGFRMSAFAADRQVERLVWVSPDEEDDTERHYRALLAEHGDSFKTLNWGSAAGQLRRFEVLAAIANLSESSVLDVGCGLAHFADWLSDKGIRADYTGLDLVPALLEAAAARRSDLKLVAGSILDESVLAGRRYDYVFASGIFATYSMGAEDTLKASVCRMWSLASKGVAFNALSCKAKDQDASEYYADPERVLAFCKALTPQAFLLEDYHPRDFTVHLVRPDAVA